MNYLIVGVGGAFGSVARYVLGKAISARNKGKFPIGTFLINITGAILLGVVSSMKLDKSIYLILADGFLGGYTTFSTFMYEEYKLLEDNYYLNAFIYIIASIIIGIIGFMFGIWISA